MRGFYGWLYARFFLIKCANLYVSFESLPETSEEGLTLELSVFESLYGDQFEFSIQLIKKEIILLYSPLEQVFFLSFFVL